MSDRTPDARGRWGGIAPSALAFQLIVATTTADSVAQSARGEGCRDISLYEGKQLQRAGDWRAAREALLEAYASKQDAITAQRAVWILLKEAEQTGAVAVAKDNSEWHREMLARPRESAVAAAAIACRAPHGASAPNAPTAPATVQRALEYLRDVCQTFEQQHPGTQLSLVLPEVGGDCLEQPRWALTLWVNQRVVAAPILMETPKLISVQLQRETNDESLCGEGLLAPCIVAATGATVALAALVSGSIAWSRTNRLADKCPDNACPEPSFESDRRDARTVARLADYLWIASGALAGIGIGWYGVERFGSRESSVLTAACSTGGCWISAGGTF